MPFTPGHAGPRGNRRGPAVASVLLPLEQRVVLSLAFPGHRGNHV